MSLFIISEDCNERMRLWIIKQPLKLHGDIPIILRFLMWNSEEELEDIPTKEDGKGEVGGKGQNSFESE